ncbi:MAG: CoA transferase [Desulfobacterales bacterium]
MEKKFSSRTTEKNGKKALDGLKVVEYGQMISGPYCTKMLADLGAEVIKIEPPGSGDTSRAIGPFADNIPHIEGSGLFSYLNTNKMGITLNPGSRIGKNLFTQILEQADILVENNPPYLLKKWGMAYEDLAKDKSELIMASISPFGQSGPYKDFKGCELITYHTSGAGHTTPRSGKPDQAPLKVGARVTEFYAGMNAALAVMAAVLVREMTRKGQYIDISSQECFLNNSWAGIPYWMFAGDPMGRGGRHPWAPMAILPCRDGYVSFQFQSEQQWQDLVELMGTPDWAESELFKDQFARGENWDGLELLMIEWLNGQSKQAFFHAAQAKRCPVGPVNRMDEVLNCEHLADRGFFVNIDIPGTGGVKCPSAPYRFSKTPWQLVHPAPTLGQHNEAIYCKRLGYSRKDLSRIRGLGII